MKLTNEIEVLLENGEKKSVFIESWNDHIKRKDTITSFTTIIGEKLFHIEPNKSEVFLPYIETHGNYDDHWIVSIDLSTEKETFRKSTKNVDMIHWKLFSS